MPSDVWTTSWSEVDANNSQAAPEGWAAGMFPNAVEPTARMNMGAVKRFWNRINPVYAAVLSTTDTYTVSPTVAPPGYGLYELWRVRMPSANTATSPTINTASLGPQLIKKYSASSITALSAGDIQPQAHTFYFDGTQLILRDPFQPAAAAPAPVTNSLGSDVVLNSTSTYFDGPSVAQGSVGTWLVTATVTVTDTSAAIFHAILQDGTTIFASTVQTLGIGGDFMSISLSAIVSAPAGNLRISVKDVSTTSGKILFNQTGKSKDSTITAYRIA